MNWIYLNKNNSDEYIEMFACGSGAGSTTLETWNYNDNNNPVVIRGIMKHKIIKRCWQDGRKFRYMDSGYLGNRQSSSNPHGWKWWHRIVDNYLQHGAIVKREDDRWKKLGYQLKPRRHGSKILIAAPDEKPCIFYGINLQEWLDKTIAVIKQHTDREIVVRERNPNRQTRVSNSLESALDDVHALVTYNSIAATEAIIEGVPSFTLAPANAAMPVANTDLTKIDEPWWPDQDQRHAWACHLAYGQFHINELRDGTAARILDKTEELSYA
jgi:hypothetical protein